MGYARYVGRVGGLAVALGVGVAVATTPGVAWAAPETGSTETSTAGASTTSTSGTTGSASTDSSDATASAGEPSGEGAGSTEDSGETDPGEDEPTDSESSSKKSTGTTVKDKKSGSDFSAATPKKPKRSVVSAPSRSDVSKREPVADRTAPVQPKSEPVSTAPAVRDVSVVEVASVTTAKASLAEPVVVSEPQPVETPLSSALLSAVGLAPSADDSTPELPAESPLTLLGLAALRRQTQQASTGDESLAKTSAEPSQSSLMVADTSGGEPMMAAAANSAPSTAPVVGTPDQSTGAVQVSLNATDADGNPLTYSVTSQPTGGSVEALGAGQFRYTPSVSSRLAAGTTATPDFDSFTVTVSDGQGGSTPVNITVPKLPAVWANQPSSSNVTGTRPYGVAMVGDLAYVANQGTNTVTVINTKTGAVVGNPIQVGTAPTGVLATADGSKVYVTNRTSGTVSVIRTSDNSVTSVKVGTSPEFMALNDTGTRLYVTNYGSSSVSVIDTATNKLIDVNPSTTTVDAIKVGAYPRGIAFTTVNGQPRLYVVSRAGNSVSVIDANTNKLIDANPATTTIDSIKVGTTPEMIAIRDGYAYVTNYASNSVSVINTATNKVEGSAIPVGTKPAGLALSNDGSLLYVANGNDTVSVINVKTRTLITSVSVDTAPESNYHIIAVRSDGGLIVTDMADRAVRVLTYQRGNTAPTSIANPTVGTPNSSTGAVSGSVAMKDWDGDMVAYAVPTQPASGTVTVTTTGGYTYTPTLAARQQAAQTPNATFNIRVTDAKGAFTDVPVTVPITPVPVNQAPWVPGKTIPGGPDPVTGIVTGQMNVRDPDGNALTYTLAEPPSQGGTVTFDQSTGRFTYTPSQSARNAAALTPRLDYDTFGVNATDGIATVHTSVTVQVSPTPPPTTPTTTAAVAAGSGPSGSAVAGGYAYVINYDSNNVTVVNAATNQFVKTIDVGQGPLSVAANDARKRVYVTNSASNTVSVIDANTNTVIDTIDVPVQPGTAYDPWWGEPYEYPNKVTEVAVSGNRLYVNATDGRMYVVDTTNDANSVINSASLGTFSDLDVSPDGTRLYGVRGDGLTVINTSTMTATDIAVGPSWNDDVMRNEYTSSVSNAAVSPDGKRAYVTYGVTIAERGVGGQPSGAFFTDSQGRNWMITGGYNAVSIIDTDPTSANYNTEIARIIVPSGTQDVAVSGSNLYVTSGDGKTVTIINTTNNALVGTFTTDQTSSGYRDIYLDDYWTRVAAFTRYITVGPNGVVYVTDYTDGKMYAVTVGSPNV